MRAPSFVYPFATCPRETSALISKAGQKLPERVLPGAAVRAPNPPGYAETSAGRCPIAPALPAAPVRPAERRGRARAPPALPDGSGRGAAPAGLSSRCGVPRSSPGRRGILRGRASTAPRGTPPPRSPLPARGAGRDAPGVAAAPARHAPGGCGPAAPSPPGPARPPRCGSAARRLPHPLGASAAPLRARPEPAPAGGGPGSPGGGAGGAPAGDGARQPPPERPFRGLCLRCHMGRGAGFKRGSAGHAVSGAPQPCPQRQRSARPGMRL